MSRSAWSGSGGDGQWSREGQSSFPSREGPLLPDWLPMDSRQGGNKDGGSFVTSLGVHAPRGNIKERFSGPYPPGGRGAMDECGGGGTASRYHAAPPSVPILGVKNSEQRGGGGNETTNLPALQSAVQNNAVRARASGASREARGGALPATRHRSRDTRVAGAELRIGRGPQSQDSRGSAQSAELRTTPAELQVEDHGAAGDAQEIILDDFFATSKAADHAIPGTPTRTSSVLAARVAAAGAVPLLPRFSVFPSDEEAAEDLGGRSGGPSREHSQLLVDKEVSSGSAQKASEEARPSEAPPVAAESITHQDGSQHNSLLQDMMITGSSSQEKNSYGLRRTSPGLPPGEDQESPLPEDSIAPISPESTRSPSPGLSGPAPPTAAAAVPQTWSTRSEQHVDGDSPPLSGRSGDRAVKVDQVFVACFLSGGQLLGHVVPEDLVQVLLSHTSTTHVDNASSLWREMQS